jgi:hypothetical protein
LKPSAKISLSLPVEQVNLLVEKTLITGELLAVVYAAKVRDNVVTIQCTLAQLAGITNHVELAARKIAVEDDRLELLAITNAIRTLMHPYSADSSTVKTRAMNERQQDTGDNVISINVNSSAPQVAMPLKYSTK